MATLVVARAAAVLTDSAEAMRVVHEQTELVFLFVLANLGKLALVACHPKDALGHHEDAASGMVREVFGAHELLLEALHVVVLEHKTLALVQTHAIHHARVRLTVVHNHVVAGDQRLNGGLATLVPEVEQERVLLLHEIGKLLLEGFVLGRLA